ncbi:MAG: hypothetical protein CM1200mP41_02850 [Gammaproteobacteria bacterium]|nr:MAG: hypothetical protein CM1200mP41_02850 [Gammaproteobacteria bacterium]
MGISPWLLALDLLSIADGENFLLHTFENYADGNFDVLHEMLTSKHTICGLGDAGAHVATICDAGYPTFMLQHWGRDRVRGPKLISNSSSRNKPLKPLKHLAYLIVVYWHQGIGRTLISLTQQRFVSRNLDSCTIFRRTASA